MLLLGFMRYLIIAVWMIFTIQGACCFHLESGGEMWLLELLTMVSWRFL